MTDTEHTTSRSNEEEGAELRLYDVLGIVRDVTYNNRNITL